MIMAVWSTESAISKASGLASRDVNAKSAPQMPAKKPLSRKACALARETSMPMPRATSSLSRTTRKARPMSVRVIRARNSHDRNRMAMQMTTYS